MCDFKVRRLGNVHRYTVQCVLPINLYTEKIYIFLWFWLIFVAAASIVGFTTWLLRMLMRGDKVAYAKNHLKSIPELKTEDLDIFIDHYLQQDGMFLLRLIGHNTNNITVTEIMEELYGKFIEKQRKTLPQPPPSQNPDMTIGADQPDYSEKQPLTS